ncbi:MAG: hypothetical protein HUJ61_08820, partial [Bacilli bacterium]|nr:hypothetical protein [Bacilli bacterium]
MRRKEYKVPKKHQPIFGIVKLILKPFYRCRTVSEIKEIPAKAIVLSNHSKKSGPVSVELNYPRFNIKWGAHEMLGNYKSRFHYLRDVFYMQKQGMKKSKAGFKAAIEAIFSKMIYKGMKLIGTYEGAGLVNSLKDSFKVLDAGYTIAIFPEDSSKGYFETISSC